MEAVRLSLLIKDLEARQPAKLQGVMDSVRPTSAVIGAGPGLICQAAWRQRPLIIIYGYLTVIHAHQAK